MASVSALGNEEQEVWSSYNEGQSLIEERDFGKFRALVSSIQDKHWSEINALRENKQYRELDPSVASRHSCFQDGGVKSGMESK